MYVFQTYFLLAPGYEVEHNVHVRHNNNNFILVYFWDRRKECYNGDKS